MHLHDVNGSAYLVRTARPVGPTRMDGVRRGRLQGARAHVFALSLVSHACSSLWTTSPHPILVFRSLSGMYALRFVLLIIDPALSPRSTTGRLTRTFSLQTTWSSRFVRIHMTHPSSFCGALLFLLLEYISRFMNSLTLPTRFLLVTIR